MILLLLSMAGLARDEREQATLEEAVRPGDTDATMLRLGTAPAGEVAVRQLASGLRMEMAFAAFLDLAKETSEGLLGLGRDVSGKISDLITLRTDALAVQRESLVAQKEFLTNQKDILAALKAQPTAKDQKELLAAVKALAAPPPAPTAPV
jgi:hypothetical protein